MNSVPIVYFIKQHTPLWKRSGLAANANLHPDTMVYSNRKAEITVTPNNTMTAPRVEAYLEAVLWETVVIFPPPLEEVALALAPLD